MQGSEAVAAVAAAPSWDTRIALIRRIPEQFGTAQHQAIYADIAKAVYVPHLAPDFAYVHWRDDYELEAVAPAYDRAFTLTRGFSATTVQDIANAIRAEPSTLRVFRLILGFTTQEFAAATTLVADRIKSDPVGNGRVKAWLATHDGCTRTRRAGHGRPCLHATYASRDIAGAAIL
jgi:hypothetical protein